MLNKRTVFILAACFLAGARFLFADGEISIQGITYLVHSPHRYEVIGSMKNETEEPREVVYRAQLTFYEKTAPVGDKPAFLVRKDVTIILRPGERKKIRTVLLAEGTPPKGALRAEPILRIRRQRPWNY